MPAAIPVARNPAGAVTPWVRINRPSSHAHGATPTIESPSVSGHPSARFIDCTAAPPVPFTRLSIAHNATARPRPRRRRRRAGRRCCRSPRRSSATDPPAADARKAHRHRPFRRRPAPRDSGRGGARGAGGQDAARRRDQHRGERHGDVLVGDRAQALRDLRRVPVLSADVVRACRPDDLRAEQVDLGGPARAGGAADGDNRDGGFDEVRGKRGQQREQRCRRIAAGHSDALGAPQPVPAAGQLGQSVGPAARVRRAVEPLPAAASVSRKSAPQSTIRVSGPSCSASAAEWPCGRPRKTTSWPARRSSRWAPAPGPPAAAGAGGVRRAWCPRLPRQSARRCVRRPSAYAGWPSRSRRISPPA